MSLHTEFQLPLYTHPRKENKDLLYMSQNHSRVYINILKFYLLVSDKAVLKLVFGQQGMLYCNRIEGF